VRLDKAHVIIFLPLLQLLPQESETMLKDVTS
jgi:hypothetical protein